MEQLVATRAATPFELRHGTIPTYTNPTDNSKLITFRRTDGGQTRYRVLVCAARNECKVGNACSNAVLHPASRASMETLAPRRLR